MWGHSKKLTVSGQRALMKQGMLAPQSQTSGLWSHQKMTLVVSVIQSVLSAMAKEQSGTSQG